jgi:hypothetical protein
LAFCLAFNIQAFFTVILYSEKMWQRDGLNCDNPWLCGIN